MSKLKNSAGKGNFFHNLLTARKYRMGGFALLTTVLVVAVAVLVNVILGMVEDTWALSIDLSPSRVTKFDDATYTTIDEVDKDIVIHLIYSDSTNTELKVQLEEMAKKYAARNSHISYDFIDPYTEPTRLQRYVDTQTVNLSEGSVIVSRADDTKSRYILRTDLYTYSYVEDSSSSLGFSYQQAFDGEAKLTSAVKFVNSDETPNVYFLTGHKEMDMNMSNIFVNYLRNENYNVASLTLGGETVPGAGDTIVINTPQTDLTDEEYEELSEWLENGGRLLMAQDSLVGMDDLDNFKALLDIYSLSFGEGIVVEDSNATDSWINTPAMINPQMNTEHDITSTLTATNGYLRAYLARPINECDMPLSGVQYSVLLNTSDGAYVKPVDSETDILDTSDAISTGKQVLAYSAMRSPDMDDPSKDTRIVLLSSPYFFVDTNLLQQSFNLDFVMAAMEWLVNHDVSVYVRASQIVNNTLSIPDASTAITIAVFSFVIPLAVAVVGIVVWVRRRRL